MSLWTRFLAWVRWAAVIPCGSTGATRRRHSYRGEPRCAHCNASNPRWKPPDLLAAARQTAQDEAGDVSSTGTEIITTTYRPL